VQSFFFKIERTDPCSSASCCPVKWIPFSGIRLQTPPSSSARSKALSDLRRIHATLPILGRYGSFSIPVVSVNQSVSSCHFDFGWILLKIRRLLADGLISNFIRTFCICWIGWLLLALAILQMHDAGLSLRPKSRLMRNMIFHRIPFTICYQRASPLTLRKSLPNPPPFRSVVFNSTHSNFRSPIVFLLCWRFFINSELERKSLKTRLDHDRMRCKPIRCGKTALELYRFFNMLGVIPWIRRSYHEVQLALSPAPSTCGECSLNCTTQLPEEPRHSVVSKCLHKMPVFSDSISGIACICHRLSQQVWFIG